MKNQTISDISETPVYIHPYARQHIALRLPQWKINSIKKHCEKHKIPFTVFCEQAIDKKMEEKKVEKLQPRIMDTWGDDIESMPLVPELQRD